MLTRRGFTLVELMVALVMLGIISAAIYRVLVNNQRIYLAQTQRIDLQQNIRAAVTILPAELRELNASDGDILAMSATSITVRATRQLGILCGASPIGPLVGNVATATLAIRRTPRYGVRDFDITTDSVFVYYEGNQGNTNDDGWLRGRLTGGPVPVICPDGANSPADQYTASMWFTVGQVAATGRVPNGAPVRGYEPVTYSLYQAGDGRWYLGYQSPQGGGTRQPLIGPLTGATGVLFQYFDANGVATAVPAQVAQIQFTLWAETAQRVRNQQDGLPGYVTDSIVTTVSLRNNRRPEFLNTVAPGS